MHCIKDSIKKRKPYNKILQNKLNVAKSLAVQNKKHANNYAFHISQSINVE